MEQGEFEIFFSDSTLIEADAEYEKVKLLFDDELLGHTDWMLRTNFSLISIAGIAEMVLHFYSDKSVYIMEYSPSIKEVFYNPDIQYLAQWLQDKGWDVPTPHKDLIESDKELWKHFWQTYLINSDYLDSRYGKRESLTGE